MKKLQVIKYAVVGCVGYLLVCGYHAGAGTNGYDCTGAETGLGNMAGCTTGGGCHANSATAGITVALELDSAGGKATKYYIGGGKYTIKITGKNTLSSNQPKFGFQVNAIKGSAAVTTPTNAGTFTSPYPASTHLAPPTTYDVLNIVEQSTQISPTTGSGGNGTTYVETINWTAPAVGTGTCSIWGALNAVNNNGNADAGDLWNTNHIVITEIKPTGIDQVSVSDGIKVYPNPFSAHATFTLTDEVNNASLIVYDITGKELKHIVFSGKEVILEKDNLASGIYFYNIISEDQNLKTGKIIVE